MQWNHGESGTADAYMHALLRAGEHELEKALELEA